MNTMLRYCLLDCLLAAAFLMGFCTPSYGQYDSAIAQYTQALTLNPKDTQPHPNRGTDSTLKGNPPR